MKNLLLNISPKTYFNFQIKIFTILLILNFLFAPFFLNNNLDPFNVHKLFIFELERNLPTLFATFNFFSSSIISYYIYLSPIFSKKYKQNWIFFSILFSFLGIDEFACIHEKLGSVFMEFHEKYNLFDFLNNWMSLYIFIIFIILIFNFKFLKNMEENLFKDTTFAFILYVSGAILMEGNHHLLTLRILCEIHLPLYHSSLRL